MADVDTATQDAANETPETPKAKKASVCEKRYITPDGNETSHAEESAVALRFKFANGNAHEVKPNDFPDAIQTCLAFFGISEKLGNSYAGAKGDADDAEDKFLTLYEQLTGGEWVKTREGGGPRPSMLVEAVVAALESEGQEVDDARRESIKDKLKTQDARKAALANAAINAQYERIRFEAQQERLRQAEEAAQAEGGQLSDF